VLLWGSILGFTCLLEVSILEIAILGGAAANLAEGTLYAAFTGGLAMFLFALGASIPIIIAAAGFAAYIDRVETQERLISLRVTGSLVMVMIGSLLIYRYLILLANLLATGEV
jgi:cytochrome c biogenesis protein CcdA